LIGAFQQIDRFLPVFRKTTDTDAACDAQLSAAHDHRLGDNGLKALDDPLNRRVAEVGAGHVLDF
jgi:hypothetical protein